VFLTEEKQKSRPRYATHLFSRVLRVSIPSTKRAFFDQAHLERADEEMRRFNVSENLERLNRIAVRS